MTPDTLPADILGTYIFDQRNASEQDPRASLSMALRAAVGVMKLGASPEFLELVPVSVSSRLSLAGA